MKSSPIETGIFFARDHTAHPRAFSPAYKSTVLRSPQRALISFPNPIGEITGPAFGQNILGALDADLIYNFVKSGESAIGERIIVHGKVLDERGKPVPSVLIEVSQANAGGRYRHKREGYVASRCQTRMETICSAQSRPALIHGPMA